MPLPIVPPPGAWLSTNIGVVISALGTMFAGACAAVAAWFGRMNHKLATEIHVNTDGRLTAMMDELKLLRAARTTEREQATAATLLASDKSTHDIAEASKAASTNVNMPGAEVHGQIPPEKL